ncbi:MAG: DUF4392 domain-containing protein [Lachnospiraceae bacterium]
MDAKELAELNIGEDLDQLINLDPRGYGVCRILYKGTRAYMGEPAVMKCAKKLKSVLRQDDIVYIITGFVLLPHRKAETDGIIGAMLFARLLVKAYGAKPVIICPEECKDAVRRLSVVVGLHLYDSCKEIRSMPIAAGRIVFTKEQERAEGQATEILRELPPKAVIAIEAPGANAKGVYHTAKGLDVTELEAKTDVLFHKCREAGILTIAIGDLGNELGMGTLKNHLQKYVPYMEENGCVCGCGGGSSSAEAADYIITTTISHWGAQALIAATAWLFQQPELIHGGDMEKEAIKTASNCGMVDMNGWVDYAIDGIGMDFHLCLLEVMRQCVVNSLRHFAICGEWFERVIDKKFFEPGA